MEDLCHFSEFSFSGVEDKYSSSNDSLWATEGLNEVKKVHFSGAEDWGESSGFGFIPNDPTEDEGYLLSTKYHQQPSYEDYGPLDNLQFDMVSPPLQPYLGENIQFDEQNPTMVPLCDPTKDKYNSTHLTSLEILKNYGKGFKRLCDEGKNMQPVDDLALVKNEDGRKLSTEDVMRIAGTRFIQSSSESAGLQSLVNHPFGLSFSELSDEEKEDVELAESLLAAAEKVGNQQFERATKLLSHCESLSSKTGNPVKRVVYYFAEALRQRIDRETGRVSFEDLKKMQSFDPEEAFKDLNPTLFAFDEMLPFCQVARFTAVQAIMENITEAKKIHIIDLEIRKGVQWLILMQSLESRHECPLELLKITAVGSGNTSIHIIEDTGKRLKDFAQSLNIPFSFNIVTVSDMLHLKEDLFERDPEETIAVYAPYALGGKIQQQNQLETIMRVVRTINPIVMVVAELEANHNSTTFVKRFIEALFYFSASFDCFATCMERDERRMAIESVYYRAIKNIVAAEGAERKVRYVKIDVWRAFFSRFGMEETELSMLSIYQADLVAKRFPFGSFCTFDRNGHCLLIGWKGTPFYSVSVWKFI
ncbi:DELLA protein RGL1-like [Gastrolobium bilobum]|uniref:DELLA protein RGL1-like n=1 Tax=Gastrolobium bilobum TaxID=150636 RepID=UPI002AB12BDB|nr:DELLA protein RGL1-like [Gastrolobium bilobum]